MQSRKRLQEDNKLIDLIIVDGYNFIFNFIDRNGMSEERLMYLREKLISDLVQYKYQNNCDMIVVFDGSRGSNPARSYEKKDKVDIVYSKRKETADTVIEAMVKKYSGDRKIHIVTSDYSQQKTVFGKNTFRKSSREFGIEINNIKKRTGEAITRSREKTDKSFYQLEKRLKEKARIKISKLRKE